MEKSAKQIAIEKAWIEAGFSFEIIKDCIDENGIYNFSSANSINIIVSELEYLKDVDGFRPKSLKGIETNNGWVMIESEEDLPKTGDQLYDVIVNGKKFRKPCFFDEGEFVYQSNDNIWKCEYITHYKPIEPELLPIY